MSISFEIKFIISFSDSDIDKSESKFPKILFCWIKYIISKKSFKKIVGWSPSLTISLNCSIDFFWSPWKINLTKLKVLVLSDIPNIFLTDFSFTSIPSIFWLIRALSKSDNESLTDPSDAFAIRVKASDDIFPFSISKIFLRLFTNSFTETLCRSNLWHLEIIVTGIFFTSVVAKINFRWGGGSSSVFNSPLNACLLSICTSSKIIILYLAEVGLYFEESINSLTSSIPVFEAASISITSRCLELVIPSQDSQLQFSSLRKFLLQFNALAIKRAVVVFPTPRMPVNK